MTHPPIKFAYWSGLGRLVTPRLALAYAGIPCEVESVAESWGTVQHDRTRFPTGDIPVLYVGDRIICESLAINHYVGLLTDLWPSDPLLGGQVMEIFATTEEIYTSPWGCNLYKTVARFNPGLTDDEAKKLKEGPFIEHLRFYLNRLNQIVEQNGHRGFSVGNRRTISDFLIFNLLNSARSQMASFAGVPSTASEGFAALDAVFNSVVAIDDVKVKAVLKEVAPRLFPSAG
jgi:glutathione S-transferase